MPGLSRFFAYIGQQDTDVIFHIKRQVTLDSFRKIAAGIDSDQVYQFGPFCFDIFANIYKFVNLRDLWVISSTCREGFHFSMACLESEVKNDTSVYQIVRHLDTHSPNFSVIEPIFGEIGPEWESIRMNGVEIVAPSFKTLVKTGMETLWEGRQLLYNSPKVKIRTDDIVVYVDNFWMRIHTFRTNIVHSIDINYEEDVFEGEDYNYTIYTGAHVLFKYANGKIFRCEIAHCDNGQWSAYESVDVDLPDKIWRRFKMGVLGAEPLRLLLEDLFGRAF